MEKKKITLLQCILTILFVVAILISNIISSKQLQLPYNITITCAIIIFPIIYILSDVFSEVYGYRRSRVTSYIWFAMNLFMVWVFSLAIVLPFSEFWTEQEAFATVLWNTPRILLASLFAYMVWDFVNDQIFRKMKMKHPNSHQWFSLRAIVSSFVWEVVDSSIFIPLAFWGVLPTDILLTMIIVQVSLKMIYEVIMLPITTMVVKKVSEYEKNL